MADNKHNLTNPDLWVRLLYMFIFALLLTVARVVIWVVAFLQFLLVLITGGDNHNLRDLGQVVSRWSLQAHLFLTFNSDDKPFPFDDWPALEPSETEWQGSRDRDLRSSTAPAEDAADDVPSFTEGRNRSDRDQR